MLLATQALIHHVFFPQTLIEAFESLERDISVGCLGMKHETLGIAEQIVLNWTMHDRAVTVPQLYCVNSIGHHPLAWPGRGWQLVFAENVYVTLISRPNAVICGFRMRLCVYM